MADIFTQKDSQREACKRIDYCRRLRSKYVYKPLKEVYRRQVGALFSDAKLAQMNEGLGLLPKSLLSQFGVKFDHGTAHVVDAVTQQPHVEFEEIPSFTDFLKDLNELLSLINLTPAKTLCHRRLQTLEARFELHLRMNDEIELRECQQVPYKNFYNVHKVDNHVHHSACMHQKHLLAFMRSKMKTEPETIVEKNENEPEICLKDVLKNVGISPDELSITLLDVDAEHGPSDKFNLKYNPLEMSQFRHIFLTIDNYMKGRFFAELTQEVFADLEWSKHTKMESRLSIHGIKKEEWKIVADWVCDHKLRSDNVRWIIQIPRLYYAYQSRGLLKSFGEMLENIFLPLFQVTIDPSSSPSLHRFLQAVVGFDSVGDESVVDPRLDKHLDPNDWTSDIEPSYTMYLYYIWANLVKLNKLREERGMNTFAFRPHSGETGDINHLASAYILAHSISHGIVLKESPVLQYLYYLDQVGISVSPLSNNILVCKYNKNPFPEFFKRGLNVTLSTNDPLLIHYTKDALLEEYSICAQVFNLLPIDLCEIARNSILQSNWDEETKRLWIGKNYLLRGSTGNDVCLTGIPNTRVEYRDMMLRDEESFVKMEGYPTHHVKREKGTKPTIVGNLEFPLTEIEYMASDPNDLDMDDEEEYEDEENLNGIIAEKRNDRGISNPSMLEAQELKDNQNDGVIIGTVASAEPATNTPVALNDMSIVGIAKTIVKSPKMQRTPTSGSNTPLSATDTQSGHKSRTEHPARAQGNSSKGKRTREEHDTKGARAEIDQIGSRGEYDENTGQVLDENLEERKRKLSYEEFPNDLVQLEAIAPPGITKTSAIDPTNMGPLLPIDFELMKEQERQKQREQVLQSSLKGRSPSPKFMQNANISRPPNIINSFQMNQQGNTSDNPQSAEMREESTNDSLKEKHVSFDLDDREKEDSNYIEMDYAHMSRDPTSTERKEYHMQRSPKAKAVQNESSRAEQGYRDELESGSTTKKNVLITVDGLLSFIKDVEHSIDESNGKSEDTNTANDTISDNLKGPVNTLFGTGELLQADTTHCSVKLPTMNVYVRAENCMKIPAKENAKDSPPNLLHFTNVRAVQKEDLSRICEIEKDSYPADEAASPEQLYYRFIFASEYFKVLTYNDQVIGYICGTLTDSDTLTHESMHLHVNGAKTLCIHSVAIDKDYRRNKFATHLMKNYLQIMDVKIKKKEIHAIKLLSKKHLIPFYQKAGFILQRKSDINHGKEPWYEMIYT